MNSSKVTTAEQRARLSLGTSESAIYELVARNVKARHPGGGTLLDVGCGTGNLWTLLKDCFDCYVGTDIVRYDGFPREAKFHAIDLNDEALPLPEGFADVVTAVETIEHLENPRQFARELVRVAKPGGWVAVTTPNQRSLLSLITLVVKGQFSAFQAVDYPAHLTALLESDLRRIAEECGLADVAVDYSGHGRIILTSHHYPRLLSRLFPRACSDNLMIIGRKVG